MEDNITTQSILSSSYIQGGLIETRRTLFENTYFSIYNLPLNVLQTLHTLLEKAQFIWIPHADPNVEFESTNTKYWPVYGDAQEWELDASCLKAILNDRGISTRDNRVPNFFLKWLIGEKVECINGTSLEPEKGLFFEGFGAMNCADFVFYVLYLSKILSKEQIREKYRTEFDLYSISEDKYRNSYYGLDYNHMVSVEQAKPGDIIVMFKGEDPAHIFFKGNHDEGIGLWTLDSKDLCKGNRYFPQTLSIDKFTKKYSRYDFYAYPLENFRANL